MSRAERRFAILLGWGLAAVVAYHFVPTGAANTALWAAIGAYGVAGLAFAARRRPAGDAHPFVLMSVGLGLLVAGDVEFSIEALLGHQLKTPSASDVLYLVAYPILAAGVVRLHRHGGRSTAFDAVIVTVAVATAVWSPLFASFQASAGHRLAERLTLGAYPMWDLLILFLVARFALARGARAPWRLLLTAGVVTLLVGDTLWAASATTYSLGDWMDDTWLVSYVLIGSAGFHPSAWRADGRVDGNGFAPRRFVGLAIPVALMPAVQVAALAAGHSPGVVDAVLTSGLLLLLLVRLGSVVARLHGSEAQFRRIFADAPAGMAIIAPDGRIASANAALASIAKAEEDSLVGRSVGDFVFLEDREVFEASFADALAGRPRRKAPRRLRAADGSEVFAEINTSRLDVGAAKHVVAHIQDVTVSRHLQHELAERNAQLEQADRLKDELISVVSHDLRTPLTSIMGYLELAVDEADDALPDACRDYLAVARRNAERLHRLVEDLLFVSRVQSGRGALDLEPLDVGRLVRDAVENALPAASSASIVLSSRCDSDVEAVVDGHRVTEAVENLLSNALKFTPQGGRVDVRVVAEPDAVVIRVADTGVGVPPEDVEHLFDRFFRASGTDGVPGAGLGLSIVKAIVDAHGGSVGVASEPGEGTTFELRLPRIGTLAAAGLPA
ncbi:MAG TPA: PAS domain-containing sensor histidine kinase [Gaiellaceae bacterium]|nr:PAS domain-containing sensor histidine kinase [Gaiellaceae bacterium]